MSKLSEQTRQIIKTFHRSWLASENLVEGLHAAVVARQNALLLGLPSATKQTPGWTATPGNFTIRDFTTSIKITLHEWENKQSNASPLQVSLGAALLGELLATALHPSDQQAGKIFKITEEIGQDRAIKQRPLLALRNVLCHPGALPLDPPTSHIQELIHIVTSQKEAHSVAVSVARELQKSPRAVLAPELASWAIGKIDALGRHELVQIISANLRRRKIEVSRSEEQRITILSVDLKKMELLLERSERAKTVSELLQE